MHPDGSTDEHGIDAPDKHQTVAEDRGGLEAPRAFDLRHYVDFNLEAATGRRVVTTDVYAVDLVCLEPGQQIEARTFPTADVLYTVLGGSVWIVTDDAQITLSPLQTLAVPAEVAHGLHNDSADPLLLHVVVSPPDEAPSSIEGPAPEAEEAPAEEGPEGGGVLDRLRRVLSG
jgi:quercetin dioxygenase-like cupin family protein